MGHHLVIILVVLVTWNITSLLNDIADGVTSPICHVIDSFPTECWPPIFFTLSFLIVIAFHFLYSVDF